MTNIKAEDLTRKLYEAQSKGLQELYERINENISIITIIEKSKAFKGAGKESLKPCH